jgi:hypothetical protein
VRLDSSRSKAVLPRRAVSRHPVDPPIHVDRSEKEGPDHNHRDRVGQLASLNSINPTSTASNRIDQAQRAFLGIGTRRPSAMNFWLRGRWLGHARRLNQKRCGPRTPALNEERHCKAHSLRMDSDSGARTGPRLSLSGESSRAAASLAVSQSHGR